jgi:MSHA pilin protein MshD
MPVKTAQAGFTLVEMIAGIVVFGVVLGIIATIIIPQSRQGFDPMWQIRATELSQSLINEIDAKAFDQQSDFIGGMVRCNETTASACTLSGNLGPDAGETRATFNDIDDYHGLSLSNAAIADAQGFTPLINGEAMYQGFTASIVVMYDDNLNGINDDDLNNDNVLDTGTLVGNTKVVTIAIATPIGDQVTASFVRRNF